MSMGLTLRYRQGEQRADKSGRCLVGRLELSVKRLLIHAIIVGMQFHD